MLDNFRGIAIGDSMGKIFTKIVFHRMYHKVERAGLLGEVQGSGRKGRSTLDHLFTLNAILNQQQRRGEVLLLAFIDLRKAFDTAVRENLWKVLESMGFEGSLVAILKALYNNHRRKVQTAKGLTNWIECERGVKQGCVLSPLLFNIFLSELGTRLGEGRKGVQLGNARIPALFYADDIVLIAKNEWEMNEQLTTVVTFMEERGLGLNFAKTKIMRIGQATNDVIQWEIANARGEVKGAVDECKEYKYLGVTLCAGSKGSRFSGHEKRKCKSTNNIFGMVKTMSARVSDVLTTGETLWKKKFLPCLIYGTEVVHVTKQTMHALETLQNKIGRWLLGVSQRVPAAAVRAELGWLSVEHEIIKKRALFWGNLMEREENSWVGQALRVELMSKPHSSWVDAMSEVWNGIGYGGGKLGQKWKTHVKHSVWVVENEKWKNDMSIHPTLAYYPKDHDGNREPSTNRSRSGRVVTKLRMGDRLLLDKDIGAVCPNCGNNIEQATPHIMGVCDKNLTETEVVDNIKKMLTPTSTQQIAGIARRYKLWAERPVVE